MSRLCRWLFAGLLRVCFARLFAVTATIHSLEDFMFRRIVISMLFFVPLAQADVEAPITQVTLYPGTRHGRTFRRGRGGNALAGGRRAAGEFRHENPAGTGRQGDPRRADPGQGRDEWQRRGASARKGAEKDHSRTPGIGSKRSDIEVRSASLVTGYLGRLENGEKGALDGKRCAASPTTLDAGMKQLGVQRSQIGAQANSLEARGRSLSTSHENLSAARARIRDADIASESARMVRVQIMQQASASILSQANSRPKLALSLLQ